MQTKSLIVFVFYCWALALTASAATARLTVRVIDEAGSPVPNAEVRASTFSHHVTGELFGEDKYSNVSTVTDGSGIASLEFSSPTGDIGFGPRKTGYYYDRGLDFQFSSIQGGQWQPWNPTFEVVLKPILNPIPLYAKEVDLLSLPEQDTPMGYDLQLGGWVGPRGKGTNTDLVFNFHRQFTNVMQPFALSVDITFPNDGDGLLAVSVPKRQGSVLRMRTAPEAGYTNGLTKHIFRTTPQTPIDTGVDDNQNYFFRVRTSKTNGQITSAMYGKFYGDIELSAFGKLRFTYYLNPTPNSRNLEFNTKSNLLTNLKSFEQPNEP